MLTVGDDRCAIFVAAMERNLVPPLRGPGGAGAPFADPRWPMWLIRRVNRSLKVPRLSALINASDLDLRGWKAEQNTSTPSNPRPAGAAAFKSMLARELARQA
jgi:hypothetical protein